MAAAVPVTYIDGVGGTSPKFGGAFAHGCGGSTTRDLSTLQPGPWAGFAVPAAWPTLDQAKVAGRDFYYGDHAYYGRHQYYRITKNAQQHQPSINEILRARPDRYRAAGGPTIHSWRTTGTHVVLCPNSPIYMARYGLPTWVDDMTRLLRQFTDRPIISRWKSDVKDNPLSNDLVDAWAVVVFSSNSAVEALAAGIPIVTLAPFAATVNMGRTAVSEIETLDYPDYREGFLWSLADHQWTLDELGRGDAWRALTGAA